VGLTHLRCIIASTSLSTSEKGDLLNYIGSTMMTLSCNTNRKEEGRRNEEERREKTQFNHMYEAFVTLFELCSLKMSLLEVVALKCSVILVNYF
jgi:hypothetical protein